MLPSERSDISSYLFSPFDRGSDSGVTVSLNEATHRLGAGELGGWVGMMGQLRAPGSFYSFSPDYSVMQVRSIDWL
jgi:hypothetical protein